MVHPTSFDRALLAPRGLTLALLLANCGTLFAQTTYLDELVVTATRSEQRLQNVLADVSVIDRAQIAQSGATGLADVLARLPGVELSRNGGPGTATSLFVRGAETRHTAVLIDGVRVDSQGTGGAPWEAIPLALVDRVELVRGPAAAVYGSDAINGVIQIFTRRGEAGIAPFASVGLGSESTRDASAGVSGAANGWDYAFSVAHERSEGFNAITDPSAWGYNPDKDGYRRSSGQANLGYQINDQHRVSGSYMGSYLNAGYDGSADQDDRNKYRLHAANLSWQAQWTDFYSSTLSVSDSNNLLETEPSPYRTENGIRSYLFKNDLRLGAHHFSAALERREDLLDDGLVDRDRNQNALALGYGVQLGVHSLQANLRHDDDSDFGSETTGSLAYGLALTEQWRLHASAARAFRAPTLYQRFSEYGLETLSPETSQNYEAALSFAEGAHLASLTVYRNNVSNLIGFGAAGPCASMFGCYENTAKARYQGVTLSGETRVGQLGLQGSVDWQNPKDEETGNVLARRAKRHASLRAEYAVAEWLLATEWQVSGSRWDNAANTNRVGGYSLWNLMLSHTRGDWTLLGRIDNLTDKEYELARSYATPGRSVYVGLKWAPSR